MSCRTSVVAFALLVMIAVPAQSGYVLGVGASSCGKWIESRKARGTPAEVIHTSWVYGYLSAEAALLASDARGAVLLGKNSQTLIEKADILNPRYINPNAINAWMDNYCRAHPLETIADALRVLLASLKEKTGYLEEAVCETSDLEAEGRAGCRQTFEATRQSAMSSARALLILSNAKRHWPRPKPTTTAQPPEEHAVASQSAPPEETSLREPRAP
jgi:hypothetical protein